MKITLETTDVKLKDAISKNDIVDGKFEINLSKTTFKRSTELTEVLEFSVTFLSGATSSFVASWLYDKFKNKSRNMYINDKKVEIKIERIEKEIREVITIE